MMRATRLANAYLYNINFFKKLQWQKVLILFGEVNAETTIFVAQLEADETLYRGKSGS